MLNTLRKLKNRFEEKLLHKKFSYFMEKYTQNVKELEDMYRTYICQNVPQHDGRAQLLCELIGTNIKEVMYILHALYKAMSVEGDICEFGVAQGATSALLANEIIDMKRHLWLYDSFEGLPIPSEKDKLIDDIFHLGSIDAYQSTMKCPIDMVQSRLDRINFPENRRHIIKGWIRDSINAGYTPEKICFAYVDFDFYEPIKDTLNFLNKKVLPGAQIVVDDYGFFSEGAKTAVDEFLGENKQSYEILFPDIALTDKFIMLSRK